MGKEKNLRMKKVDPVDPKQWKRFLKKLPPDIGLLAETYKFASEAYAEIGLSYTLKELLLLPARSVEALPPCIHLYRSTAYCSKGEICYLRWLPRELAPRLVALAESRQNPEGLLFCQKNGKGISSVAVRKAFNKASKESKIIITPQHLRMPPKIDIKFERGMLPSASFRRELVQEVPENKLQAIRELIDSGISLAGRPPRHPLSEILKVLAVRRNYELTRREWEQHFPKVARAAESHQRTWVKWGIWDQIQSILDT